MNLPFSKTWPKKMGDLEGEPTLFVEKIFAGLPLSADEKFEGFRRFINTDYITMPYESLDYTPKIHTIRKLDKNGNPRWKPGMMIDFWINMRTKNQFRFAPRISVVSVQEIEIKWKKYETFSVIHVFIDGAQLEELEYSHIFHECRNVDGLIIDLATNDGFDSVDHFFRWFDQGFKGQIVHWTNFNY